MTEDTDARTAPETTPTATLSRLIRRVRARLVDDPLLCVPFLLAGVALSLIDELRRHDPVPARSLVGIHRLDFSLELVLIPSGSRGVRRILGGLTDLQPRLLLWALGLETAALGIVALAGYLTLARALDTGWSATSAGTYLLYVALTTGVFWIIGPLYVNLPLFLVMLWGPFVALWFLGLVRLFAVPAAVVNGQSLLDAARWSNDAVDNREWAHLALVTFFGVLLWLAELLSVGSTLISFAVVGPLHAVAVAVVSETRTVSE